MKNKEWQYKFLKTGTEYGFGDLSPMVGVVSEILAEQKKELVESFLKVVEEDITRNQERGFPTSAVAKQWVLTQLKHHD